jgi:hypothetical protein
MNKITFISCVIFCTCLLFGTALAQTLEVEKAVETSNISAGDDVRILLKFNNPFNREVKIKIVDKNVFGNNGLDVQCFEHTLPLQGQIVAYDPIKPFSFGNYTLDEAQVTYTNPMTGSEETIKSNKLELEVKDSGQQMQGQQQSITTIYQCGGMSMKSTTYSSSQQQTPQQQQQEEQQQQLQEEQNRPENRAQNNQMNQNTDALKQQIGEEMRKNLQMQEDFNENIFNNPDFREKNKELSDAGYNLTDSNLNPQNNNTGEFEYSYGKGNKTASVKGRMENGTMKELMSQTEEDRERMLDELMKNGKFKEYDEQLAGQGFNMTGVNFTQISQNHTKIEVSYENIIGNNTNQSNSTSVKKIIAEYRGGEIKEVYLEDDWKNKDNNLWLVLILILILISAATVYYFKVKKQRTAHSALNAAEHKTDKDYLEEVREMLVLAQKLFDCSREKDAYEKVSQAVRLYFSNKRGIKKEITNYELLNILGRDELHSKVKKCLDLCMLVEFAKYRANKEDFDEIMRIAEDVTVNK